MNVNNSRERRRHPKERANFLSKATFFYNLKILWETFKKGTFEEEQLYDVIEKCKAGTSGHELQECLRKELNRSPKVSIIKTLWQLYGFEYLTLGLIQLVVRSIVIISIPVALSKVVLYFQPGQNEISKPTAILFASLLILLNFSSVTYLHNYLLTLSELGIKIRTAFCSVIFRKCLKLSPKVLADFSAGKVITLITKDVAAIETFIFYCNDTWVGMAQAAIVFYLIYTKVGVSTLVGMGFFMAVILVQIFIGKKTSKLRTKSCKKTDERLQITKESLSAIGVIKMNNWESVFDRKINQSRRKEMQNILKIFLAKISVLLIGSLTSKISLYLLLTSYVLLGNTISAELIYYVTTLFLRIRHALNVAIPVGVTVIADVTASIKRLEQLINLEEVVDSAVSDGEQKKCLVSLTDVTVEVGGTNILKNIHFAVDSGLVIITGAVGSGKSTLLKSVLGECEFKSGGVLKKGVISYAAQEPWIFPSTLKQNIVFDEEYDEQRYQEILDVCALNFDLKRDDLKIGDKGTNLSKGQKARINLARAVYKKADIYLLDDSLSSVDTHVQKHVFQKCIKQFLADKICIFVNQNLQNLENGDRVVIMDAGRIIFSSKCGNGGSDLKTFLKSNEKSIEIINNFEENVEETSEDFALLKKKSHEENSLYEETKKSGKVNFEVYRKYGTYGGGILIISTIVIFFIATHFSKIYTEKILSDWVNQAHRNSTPAERKNTTETSLKLYTAFTISTTFFSIISAFFLFNTCRKASIKLHKNMLGSVLNTPMSFFDTHLLGNILNRFSKDLNIVDEQIPFTLYELLEIFFGQCGMIILIVSVKIVFLIPTVLIFTALYLLRKLYIPTGRNLQRLTTATRSPIIGYLTSSLEGLTTIRAFGAENRLIEEFDRHQDLYTSASYTSKCCQRAFGYYLDVCCTVFIGVVVGLCLLYDKDIPVGNVGLIITQAFTLTGAIQYGIRQWAEIENKMTSVERILEYTDIDGETDENFSIDADFPENVAIKYEHVCFKYKKNAEYVLKNINLIIASGEKVGIVGRTGSGKSTLLSLLYRLYPYEGSITLGKSNLQDIPLKTLRSNISIIPQDPSLFTGTLRTNLDPTNIHSDEQIRSSIRSLQIQKFVQDLDAEISESGTNFSVGQRQILCLARCLLNKNKIIILDEATSDMDLESEKMVGKVLEGFFENCTVVVVAHRLKTVLSCDRVVVMQEGEVVENGSVGELKEDVDSIFHGMLRKAALL